ncbi:tRNA (adenosine(37)-N6)-threonylcarbamoyltransferase complex transferase subunit TsaD [Dehalococcoides mccartyi]|uniref:tRNA N6-adenosine threonylcarbamoyltransferase n=1 Tax=Dehalococcoides mccartyi (strain VS) TaxID=311424 RepID=D2BJ20_DEHMV|nr:tRNA (adenosine(37)-N6)-threonylcarbamoyltransferase complex transferase subunit TsaD [Dehalococcoides mccartyi]ACZ62320.1 metal-dependent protease with chaperone activity [Dehalococcoides mccartyi VS]
MKILGIESSCDETAASVVEDGVNILSNRVSSQIDIHSRYGGVVPEVASRQHLLSILPVISDALKEAGIGFDEISAIAVTNGPGLAGSLIVGVNAAKSIAAARRIPLIAVNHLHGHIYANWLSGKVPEFPCLCLTVSGGHTDLVLMRGHGQYELLGHTRDDAAGEAFDKAARILGLSYPGGPAIDRASQDGQAVLDLPRSWIPGSHDFSFSGLKTALLRLVENGEVCSVNDAAASFQKAVVDVLVTKTINCAREYNVKQILMAGGVAANNLLRKQLCEQSPLTVSIPPIGLCTDNAAVIASCGYFRFISGSQDGLDMDVLPALSVTS